MELVDRVRKTIALFNENVRLTDDMALTGDEGKVVELARMYASDSETWYRKGDYVTAFSGIEYAHGLLDAILKTHGKDPYGKSK